MDAGIGHQRPKLSDERATALGREPPSEPGTKRKICTTLMSAFPSSRRVNLWLSFKRLFQALPGKAGGTAVMTTVDHTLMRGSEPHDR